MRNSAFYLFTILFTSCAVEKEDVSILWKVDATLPASDEQAHLGVAGPLTGVINDKLIIAGGANFPAGMPWDGGKKAYQKDTYIYDILENGTLRLAGQFPFADSIAYGANISDGKYLYSIGGERNGTAIQDVFRYELNEQSLTRTVLPQLPIALTNAAAVKIEKVLYLIGGENSENVSDKIYSLDLMTDKGWEEVLTLPYPLTHTVVGVDEDQNILVAGGRKRNTNAKSDMYDRVFAIDVKKKELTDLAPLPYPLAAGTAVFAKNKFIVIGGDNASTFHQVEQLIVDSNLSTDEDEKQRLTNKKNDIQRSHPGFGKEIWMLDIKTNTWNQSNSLIGKSPVTTSAILYKDLILIPSGEISAGVRTDQILVGHIN